MAVDPSSQLSRGSILGDKTRMAMSHAGVPADSPGAAGWTQAFDKLAVAVAEV